MGIVYMVEGHNDALVVGAMREKNPRLSRELGLHQGGGISLERSGLAACRKGGLVYMPDTRKLGAELARKLASAEIHCAAAVPLMVEGKLFGILAVARSDANSFSNGECEFLRMLSEHVALAAHQARLHTELEEAYNNLRKSQQAVMQQDRLRALGQMASGIAHDINNALSPVVGFAGLLLEYEPNLSASARKHLNYIKTSGSDVAHIVARLREFYRQRDGQELVYGLNLNQLTEQVIEMTQPRWKDIPQSRGIMVELEANLAGEMPEVRGIEAEVREALTNLILNAVDAMPRGGKLSVITRVRRVAYAGVGENPPTHGVLEVSDTGTGMSEETLKHCLEPFYSTKGKRGTGMGLAMAYGVMERHGGKIEIESEEGEGTTVRLIFPLTGQKAAVAAPVAHVSARSLQVLCIDDEPMLRELVKDMLEKDGHHVQTADGGQSGLDTFREAKQSGHPFDVVVSDLGMPYMDGREVAKLLKKESPTTPVVLLTGWGAFMKSDGDVPSEADGILSKPPSSNELRELLGRLTAK
jgi:signal transduction histidine kinase/ActR/RegA family two-component response regulator